MKKRWAVVLAVLVCAVVAMALVCLFVGSSNMSVSDAVSALFGRGSDTNIRIVRAIRLPRVLAAIAAGAGLSLAGLIMQTTLANPMASPGTLGVSNAAVFGANLSIIVFAGGFLTTGHNPASYTSGVNLYAAGIFAFVFAILSVLVIISLGRVQSFAPGVLVLAGIALGSVWTAATSVLQFYATDVGISAAVIWSFGDLGRATFASDAVMIAVSGVSAVFFSLMAWRYNALLGGEGSAVSMGVNVKVLRVVSLFLASLITAVCVSNLGMIGFVGVICPHAAKKLVSADHRASIPASALCGSLLLLCADALSRAIGKGSALPIGALTSLLGAPFFIALILSQRGGGRNA